MGKEKNDGEYLNEAGYSMDEQLEIHRREMEARERVEREERERQARLDRERTGE